MKKTKKQLKSVPKFSNREEEFEFWSTHDTTEYFDYDKALINPQFPNLKFSTDTISIRVPVSLLNDIKMLANKQDVPYQSLMKVYLADRVREEKEREYQLEEASKKHIDK